MSIETWGMMPKSQIDPEKIEEALNRLISEHNENEEAHLGPGQSLQSHKASEIIDHLVNSIVTDKIKNGEITTPKIAVDTILFRSFITALNVEANKVAMVLENGKVANASARSMSRVIGFFVDTKLAGEVVNVQFDGLINLGSLNPGQFKYLKYTLTGETITIDQSQRNFWIDANQIIAQTFKPFQTYLSRISLYLKSPLGTGNYAYTLNVYNANNILISSLSGNVPIIGTDENFIAFTMPACLFTPYQIFKLEFKATNIGELDIRYKDADIYVDGEMWIAGIIQPTKDLGFRLRERMGTGDLLDVAETEPSKMGIAKDIDDLMIIIERTI